MSLNIMCGTQSRLHWWIIGRASVALDVVSVHLKGVSDVDVVFVHHPLKVDTIDTRAWLKS